MTDFDQIDFFTDPTLVADPFPYFEHLRSKCPVTHLPQHDVFAVTGYDEASELLRDHATFSSCNAVTGPFPAFPERPDGDDATALIAQHRGTYPMAEYLITQDPPDHNDSRGLLMRLLTPKRLQDSEPYMVALADQLLDGLLPRGRFEVQHDLGHPFAMLVITELLGVPDHDRREFATQLGVEHPDPGVGTERTSVSHDPLRFLFDTFASYVEDRRTSPRDDVLTHMASATDANGELVDVGVVARTAAFVFAAGQDTTARLIGASLRVLGDDAELQGHLRKHPETIPDFLEEILRLDGPVKTISRIARLRTVLGGVDIPAGSMVSMFPHAANRDPRRFDGPDELRLERPNSREHVAFGRGIHSCPGGPLARVEARVMLERLLARSADLRIADDVHGPPDARTFDYVPTYILRGISALHVDVTSAAS